MLWLNHHGFWPLYFSLPRCRQRPTACAHTNQTPIKLVQRTHQTYFMKQTQSHKSCFFHPFPLSLQSVRFVRLGKGKLKSIITLQQFANYCRIFTNHAPESTFKVTIINVGHFQESHLWGKFFLQVSH